MVTKQSSINFSVCFSESFIGKVGTAVVHNYEILGNLNLYE